VSPKVRTNLLQSAIICGLRNQLLHQYKSCVREKNIKYGKSIESSQIVITADPCPATEPVQKHTLAGPFVNRPAHEKGS
jgi:hypothetical protein